MDANLSEVLPEDLSDSILAKLVSLFPFSDDVAPTVDNLIRILIHNMPKADLHVHGEAGFLVDIALARKLAERNKIPFPEELVEKVNGKEKWKYRGTQDFMIFINDFLNVSSLIRTAQDIEDVCYAYYQRCYENNVIFTLPGISWVQCKDHMTMAEFYAVYNRALSRGMEDFGDVTLMRFRYYLERHLAPKEFNAVLDGFYSCEPNPFVTTVGLAGDEKGHPLSDFKRVYEELKKVRNNSDFPWYFLTAHMEAYSNAATIQQSLAWLDWIAHGRNAADDEAVVKDMQARGIKFELCPLSDWYCYPDKIPSVGDHAQMRKLLEAELITLNSDDPSFFGDIDEVYWQVFRQCKVSFAQLLRCTERGLNPVSPQTLLEMQEMRLDKYNEHMKLVEAGKLKVEFFKAYLKLLPLVVEANLDEKLAQRFLVVDLKTSMDELSTLGFLIANKCKALEVAFSNLMGIKGKMVQINAEIKKNTEAMMSKCNQKSVEHTM